MAFSPKIDPATPVGKVQQALLDRGLEYGGGQDWQCPAHEDNRASLGVTTGKTQPVMLFCQAGCTVKEILDALDLSYEDIMVDFNHREMWRYVDENGNGLYDVHRLLKRIVDPETGKVSVGKDYRQHPAGKNRGGTKNIRHVLYDLPLILAAGPEVPIWLVEGEKSVDALQAIAQVATTNSGGSNAEWLQSYTDTLTGREVRIIADNDLPGYRAAMVKAKALSPVAKVSVWRSATTGKGDDVVDHLDAGLPLTDLVRVKGHELQATIDRLQAEKDAQRDKGVPDSSETREEWPHPQDELLTAEAILERLFTLDGYRTLHFWNGDWLLWHHDRYVMRSDDQIKFLIGQRLRKGFWISDEGMKVALHLTAAKVEAVTKLLRHAVGLDDSVAKGSLISRMDEFRGVSIKPPKRFLAVSNGLLDLDSKALLVPSPSNFVTSVLPFPYRPEAPAPARWLEFLAQTWPDEPEAVAALQEWFGYILSGDDSQQRALFLLGPPRCGKGTILNVLQHILGPNNYANPDLMAMASTFGMASCIDKLAAIIGDARYGGTVDQQKQIVTNLLRIIGNDPLQIERKYKESWNGRLPIRFVIASNTLPTYRENTPALIERMYVLQIPGFGLKEDQRDIALLGKLTAEADGILVWALEGLERLRRVGRFTKVSSTTEILQDIRDAQNPIAAFWRETFTKLDPVYGVGAKSVSRQDAYAAYRIWADDNGMNAVPAQVFARHIKETEEVMSHVAKCVEWCSPESPIRRGQTHVRVWPGWTLNVRGVKL